MMMMMMMMVVVMACAYGRLIFVNLFMLESKLPNDTIILFNDVIKSNQIKSSLSLRQDRRTLGSYCLSVSKLHNIQCESIK